MKKIIILVLSFLYYVSSLTVDIDKITDEKFEIYFDNNQYDCIKKPPVSHSWSYECKTSNLTRYLRKNKCYRECGGDSPVLFPDTFCSICIDQCY